MSKLVTALFGIIYSNFPKNGVIYYFYTVKKIELSRIQLNKIFLGELIVVFLLFFVYNNYMPKKEVFIKSDGRGYYEYLPALFIYDDIHFEYLDTLETDYYDIEVMSEMYQNPMFDKPINKYFVGTALLQSPFFGVTHFYTKVSKGEFKADGFSKPYQRSILYAAVFYLFCGLVFIRKLLETYDLNRWWIFLIQLSLPFCTSLYTYTMYDSAYSHVYSFALISGFLFTVRKYLITEKSSYIIWTFILLGLIIIVRPVNILAVLFIPFLAVSGNDLLLKMRTLFLKSWRFLLFGLLAFLVILGVQFYISYLQTGNPMSYNYGDEGFNFLSPHFIDFLFSYCKGFFLWSPWWFVIFILGALFWVKSKNYYHLITFFVAFSLLVYITSSWWAWTYGGSFGSRPMVDFYGAFALLAIPIYHSGKKFIYGLVILISIPLAVISLIQTKQYQQAIIHWNCMNKERYWEVFLNTNEKYSWYFWREKFEVGEKQSEMILFENINLEPEKKFRIDNIEVNIIDSLSASGQFVLTIDREADNEYMELRFYDSLNNSVFYEYQRLFNKQEGNQVIYGFKLSDEKLKYKKLSLFINNIKEPLKIKKATFSTHYSLY